jgi:hypothetical protein
MDHHETRQTKRRRIPGAKRAARDERSARALRENLLKRKAQMRARLENGGKGEPEGTA